MLVAVAAYGRRATYNLVLRDLWSAQIIPGNNHTCETTLLDRSSLVFIMENPVKNTLRILIATDCHIGYKEKDAVRGKDSLDTFEEILKHAKDQKVDMVLLGGDLFHSKPESRQSLHECMKHINTYCMGKRPDVQKEYLKCTSGQSVNFGTSQSSPIQNVEIPVFSIHGNHDEPSGLGNLCALDILSTSGLVNHFGNYSSQDTIEISPLVLQKGSTKLALYGLGYIRSDEKLHKMFVDKKIDFKKPKEGVDKYFNIFVIHQNRVQRGNSKTNLIPVNELPDWLDLVIWGHEHDCKVDPVLSEKGFYITQPGSSIATSLIQGEAIKKHVCLLELGGKDGTTSTQRDVKSLKVRGKDMKCTMRKIPLQTVRPFVFEYLKLQEYPQLDFEDEEQVQALYTKKVKRMIKTAEDERTSNSKQPPLIRLKVIGKCDKFNTNRFGLQFVGQVANPKDIIIFQTGKQSEEERATYSHSDGQDAKTIILGCVKTLFEDKNQPQMVVLEEGGLSGAVRNFVEDNTDSFKKYVTDQSKGTRQELKRKRVTKENILPELQKIKDKRISSADVEQKKVTEERQNPGPSTSRSDDERNPQASTSGKRRDKSTFDDQGGSGDMAPKRKKQKSSNK